LAYARHGFGKTQVPENFDLQVAIMPYTRPGFGKTASHDDFFPTFGVTGDFGLRAVRFRETTRSGKLLF
jgi:hypothetical protein